MDYKKISAASLAFTYAGCFFGAGFVSGQELWQFFGSFGLYGIFGCILAVLLFLLFGILFLRNAARSKKSSLDEQIILWKLPVLRRIFGGISLFFFFGIFIIMAAGSGALMARIFGIPPFVGGIVFSVVVCVIATFGIGGAVKSFSTLVPVLVALTIAICVGALLKFGFGTIPESTNTNGLLGNWAFSAVTYVSFNLVASFGTLAPIGAGMHKKSTVYLGIGLACLMLCAVALGILFTLIALPMATAEELPMLDVAFRLSTPVGIVYAVLLLFAMFGTSLASFVAILCYLEEKHPRLQKHRILLTSVLGLLGFVLSLFGFGQLVGTVYPIFGYVGFAVLGMIVLDYFLLIRKK